MERLKQLLGELSSFNAAEGNYLEETTKRNECKKSLKIYVKYLIMQGVSVYDIMKFHSEHKGLTSVYDLFDKDFSIITYRLVDIDPKTGTPRTLFHGVSGSRKLPLGEKLKAEVKWKGDGTGGRKYNTGFHSIETLNDMYKYLKSFKTRRERLRIGIVEVSGLFSKPNSKKGVILSRTQTLLATAPINWSQVGE